MSLLLTAVPGIVLLYFFAERNAMIVEKDRITNSVEKTLAFSTQRFAQSEPKLSSFARLLEASLVQPVDPEETAEFYRRFELNPDGVWRNRLVDYNGMTESGVFLPTNPQEGDAQRVRHLRIKKAMDIFGAAAAKPLENIWYLSPHRSEVIFDTTFPNFVFDQAATNDYTQMPWVTYTSPELNPGRTLRFTPALFDPVPKVWMVSAIYPLDQDGQWLGSLGEDMQLTNVLAALFGKNDGSPGTQHFLLDGAGNYVLAGQWQKQLEATPEKFKPDWRETPDLATILSSSLEKTPRVLSDRVLIDGRRYLAVGAMFEPLGWRYFQLVPINEVLAPMRQMFFGVVGIFFLLTMAGALTVGAGVGNDIGRRVTLLGDAMKTYTGEHSTRIAGQIKGSDEIATAARVFDSMADEIEHASAERKTAQAQLQRSEEMWRFALGGAGDGVWDWDVSSGCVEFSHQWKAMLGYSAEEIPNRYEAFEERVHPDDLPAVLAALEPCFSGNQGMVSKDFRMRCRDGSYKWILSRGMVASRAPDGRPVRIVGTHTDVTERILATEAIREAKELAERTAQAKSDFLASMSHEIRTPMNAIIGVSELAVDLPMSPELRDYLEKIAASSQSLMGILNDILDYSKLEANGMSILAAPYRLDNLIATLRDIFEERALSKQVSFCIDVANGVPRGLVGDALRLQQVLSNLLSNAVKFTARGHVALRITTLPPTGQSESGDPSPESSDPPKTVRLAFTVEDSGIGIASEDLDKLFKPFAQVDTSATRRFGGTGLGLSISQKLLKLMGSECAVSSTHGLGTVFRFEIDQGVSENAADVVEDEGRHRLAVGQLRARLREAGERLRGIRVLVVEDNLVNQMVVCNFLKLADIEPVVANNGREALDRLEAESYDAVLMDVNMPVMGGIEATKCIRAREEFARLPIIALTAGVTPEEREKCLSSGMDDFLTKPVRPDVLIEALRRRVRGIPSQTWNPPNVFPGEIFAEPSWL